MQKMCILEISLQFARDGTLLVIFIFRILYDVVAWHSFLFLFNLHAWFAEAHVFIGLARE